MAVRKSSRKKQLKKQSSFRSRKPVQTTPTFEVLESRQMLATVLVGNSLDLTNGNTSSITALVADDGGDGISLREAITAANNTSGDDLISFDGSVFTGGSSNLIRLTQGELLISESVTIDASVANNVTITGDANDDDITVPGTNSITDVAASGSTRLEDNSRVFNFTSLGGDLRLSDLTITGGSIDSGGRGGGISFSGNALTLTDSMVSGNRTAGFFAGGGGGIFANGEVFLYNSTISDNTTRGLGGGISAQDFVFLTNSTVSGNSTTNTLGGGGGGIFTQGSVSLISSTVSGNSTTGSVADGGGVLAQGSVSLINSTVSGNSTSGRSADGGGIAARDDISVTSSTLSDNSTSGSQAYGGGISGSGTVSLINSTVYGNSTLGTDADGGGIFSSGVVSVISSTVSGNTSGSVGGGIHVTNDGSSITISNSIVAGNTDDGSAPDLRSGNNARTINYSLIGATGLTILGNGNQVGTLMSPLDPLLGPLADNGGPTQTLALLAGSPAIDAGSDALAAGLSSDQRGFPFVRTFDDPAAPGASVDIGSFEVQTLSPILVVDNRVDENDGDLSAGNFSLREAIDLINDDLGANTITFDPSVFTGESNSLIRLTQGELVVTETITIDASAATDVTITGDADDNDVTNTSNITDVIETGFARLEDNSRVLNFDNPSGDLTLNSLTITGGRATGFRTLGGGGIRFASSDTFALTNSTVSGNSSSDGGGIYSLGDVSLTNSTISANLASGSSNGGGGLFAGGAVSLINSTVSENIALFGRGGGVFTRFGPLSLLNSTISGNASSQTGGGIYAYSNSPITVANSIIASNADIGGAPDLRSDNNASTINYSLIGATDSTIGGIGNQVGTLDNPLDPLLGPLADNGGLTLTHALLEGSPAIDAGNNALAVDENGNPLTTDQRGEARIQSGTVDIGAVEFDDSFVLGDANLDGNVNFLDISPFISLLSSNTFLNQADINRDGDVNFLDISPFISILASGGASSSVSKQSSESLSATEDTSKSTVTSVATVVEHPVVSAESLVSVSKPESIVSVIANRMKSRSIRKRLWSKLLL